MKFFEVRMVCTQPCVISFGRYGSSRTKKFKRGSRAKAIIENGGIRFFDSKEQCYSYLFSISDIAESFKITGSVEEGDNVQKK